MLFLNLFLNQNQIKPHEFEKVWYCMSQSSQKDLFLEVVESVNFVKPQKRWGFAILIHTWT